MNNNTEVLIAGAGPTGLVAALWLTKAGVKVRIIDKADKAGTTSRAIVLQARNLEFYHQLGIADIAVKEGVAITAGNLWVNGKQAGHVPLTDLRLNLSPYQYVLAFPQDQQEKMLDEQLAGMGVKVERNTELVAFEQTASGIKAQLTNAGGEQGYCEAAYLAGCDGAHSAVRGQLQVGFPGGTYEETFYVADLISKGQLQKGEFNIALDDADFLAIFPINGTDKVRLVGNIMPAAMNKNNLTWGDVSEGIIKRMKLEVQQVNWFSTYKVHHRVASHFRNGRVFLLGDAAHIHSPIGGQGMNTGIGDAVNLAWKIAAVIKDKAPEKLLDTYEPERIAFAQKLVDTTDRAFTFVSNRGFWAMQIRLHVVPVLLPWLASFVSLRRLLFRTISQTAIKYPQSALSSGEAGAVKGGDRLPWVEGANGQDNFAGLTTLNWQVHIYGIGSTPVKTICNAHGVQCHVFEWNDKCGKAGLKRNAVYIIRPDGYVGLAEPAADATKIAAYLGNWGIGRK